MSVVGKVYLGLALLLFFALVLWGSLLLQHNAGWTEVVFLVPQLETLEPLARRRYEVQVGTLLAGWGIALITIAFFAIRAPFRIRAGARTQRRLRDLEREVLELRTMPLRQRDEDEALAAEAHLDVRPRKVMTEKIQAEPAALPGQRGPSFAPPDRGVGSPDKDRSRSGR